MGDEQASVAAWLRLSLTPGLTGTALRRLLDALRGPKRLDLLPHADHQFTRGEDFRTMTTAMTDWLVRYLV